MPAELDILEPPPEPVYYCPGESSPVSLAVHRARQAAHWPGCRDCPGRDNDASSDPDDLKTRIRRTPWGVRGAWQNALTRLAAAQLTGVITGHLQTQQESEDAVPQEQTDSAPQSPDTGPAHPMQMPGVVRGSDNPLTLITGYDSRPSSPDLYAGVVSAAQQNGCHVVDAGRTTTAHLQELTRAAGGAAFGMIITGAGEAPAVTGLDVFDRDGNAVSVPWQSWGVDVRRVARENPLACPADPTDERDALARLRHSMTQDDLSEYPARVESTRVNETVLTLMLPKQNSGSAARFRVSRQSGTCQSVHAEDSYRSWLRRWFPPTIRTLPVCLCFDPLTAERLFWLFDAMGATADILPAVASRPIEEQLRQRIRETHAPWGFCIGEDDRFVTVAGPSGKCLNPTALSEWMNESLPATRAHVTTHVPSERDRVVMLDAGRPGQAASHETISDGTALVGCIGRIVESGTTLPRRS